MDNKEVMSHTVAEHIFLGILELFGTKIENFSKQQYATNFYGHFSGIDFVFRVHYNHVGEFTKIDWQKANSSELQAWKKNFDCVRHCILTIPKYSYHLFVPRKLHEYLSVLSLKDVDH